MEGGIIQLLRLPNKNIFSREHIGFSMAILGSIIISTTVIKLAVTALQQILTPLFIIVDIFALVVPYLFDV